MVHPLQIESKSHCSVAQMRHKLTFATIQQFKTRYPLSRRYSYFVRCYFTFKCSHYMKEAYQKRALWDAFLNCSSFLQIFISHNNLNLIPLIVKLLKTSNIHLMLAPSSETNMQQATISVMPFESS